MASSMKDIKNRIKSIKGTMQITKAMELVAASKLRRARQRVDIARPYYEFLRQTIDSLDVTKADASLKFFDSKSVSKACYILIAGDRGLAGGFNSNLFKKFLTETEGKNICAVPIGKKAFEFCRRQKIEVIFDNLGISEDVSIANCYDLGSYLCKLFKKDEIGSVYIYYTEMVSMLSQVPVSRKILPFEANPKNESRSITLYEPSAAAVFERAAQNYLSGSLYGALAESQASEFAARRMAMDNASKNAGEMIDNLTLKFNRARQAAITQEITEIVSGAEAL